MGVRLVMLSMLLVAALPRGAGALGWTRLTPPRVDEGVQVYDPVRNRVLFLLGDRLSPRDSWILDLEHPQGWQKVATSGRTPESLAAHTAIYDPRFDRILVIARDARLTEFGPGPLTVWSLSLSNPGEWRELYEPTPNKPVDRSDFSLAYDSKRGRFVLFGGSDVNERPHYDDAWSLDAGLDRVSWERLPSTGELGARSRAGAIYDASRDRVILFGGGRRLANGGSAESSADVLMLDFLPEPIWSLILGELTSLAPTAAPACLYDSLSDRMIVFSRYSDALPVRALDLVDLTQWSVLDTTGTSGPPLRGVVVGTSLDRGRGVVISAGNAVHTFALHPFAGFSRISPAPDQVVSSFNGFGYVEPPVFADQASGTALLWGGFLAPDDASARTLWRFSPDVFPHWSKMSLAGEVPRPRRGAAAAYDARRNRWLVFGGARWSPPGSDSTGSQPLDETWSFDPALLRWSQVATPGSMPLPRFDASIAYDGFRDRLVLFGGMTTGLRALGDTWSLPMDGSSGWSEWPAVGPRARSAASAIWDPSADRFVLYGGQWAISGGGIEPQVRVLSDTWFLRFAAGAVWDSVEAAPTAPFASEGNYAFFDAARTSMDVFGQGRNSGLSITALRSLRLEGAPGWSALTPQDYGPSAAVQASTFDPTADRLLTFSGTRLEHAWVLDRGRPTIEARLDFEPKDPENALRPGVLEVAILSGPLFDAATIDPATVTLAGAPSRVEHRANQAGLRDVDGDRRLDRLVRFDADRLALAPGTAVVRLDARTREGRVVVGYDRVEIRRPDRSPITTAGDPDSPTDHVRPLALSFSVPGRKPLWFHLKLPERALVRLEVYSVAGRKVIDQDLGNLAGGEHKISGLSRSEMASGVYLARVTAGEKRANMKFVFLQ